MRRNAGLYLTGAAVSLIGNSAMTLAAGIWVKSLTGSSSRAALVSVCVFAPSLLGPLAGMIADRVRQRPLLVAVNLAAAAVMLSLLLVQSRAQVWLIYAVMAGYGLAALLIEPAESALFTALLPTEVRRRVTGVRLSIQESGKLVAPLAGAGLFAVLGGGAVAALDAGTFVVAALALTLLRIPAATPRPPAAGPSRWSATAAGFRHLHATADLRTVLLAGTAAMSVSGIAVAAQYGLVDALHRPPAFLGVLTALTGAGSVVAGLSSSRLVNRIGERHLALLGLSNGAVGYLLRATGWLPTALLGSLVLGFALPWTVLAVLNLAQRRTPQELQGRVAAAVSLALYVPLPLAQALGAGIAVPLGYRPLYLIAAGLTCLTAAALWQRPGRKSRALPAAEAGRVPRGHTSAKPYRKQSTDSQPLASTDNQSAQPSRPE